MLLLFFFATLITFLANPNGIRGQLIHCSAGIEGTLGSNVISVVDNVSDESTCKQSCQENARCSVYTYRPANSGTCFLLSSIGSPVKECADGTCVTGLPDCQASAPIC